jgi:hypothetical protein
MKLSETQRHSAAERIRKIEENESIYLIGYYRALLYPPSLPSTPFAKCI